MAAAIKNLVTAMVKGWADCSAILVAADADAHKIAKQIPARINLRLYPLLCFINISRKILNIHTDIKMGYTNGSIWLSNISDLNAKNHTCTGLNSSFVFYNCCYFAFHQS